MTSTVNKILKVQGLSHKYHKSYAIENIDFEVHRSGIVALLGCNGAGKSTIMNTICGILNPTKGSIVIDGTDMRCEPEKAKRNIGFLPQTAPLYEDLTVDEYLIHCARIRLMKHSEIKAAVESVKGRCGLLQHSGRVIRTLSGGYKQRVGIAQAIIHHPRLVVLDEPTNGLDPNQIIEVRNLIKQLANDRAVILSSHILSEVELLCQHVIMIDKGQMVFSGTINAFNNYLLPSSAVIQLERPPSPTVLVSIEGVTRLTFLTNHQIRLHFQPNKNIVPGLIELSISNDWGLQEIYLEKSAEAVFAYFSNYRQG